MTRRGRGSPWSLAVGAALACYSCAGRDAQLEQHRGEARITDGDDGSGRGRVAVGTSLASLRPGTALQQTFALIGEERRTLAKDPQALFDTRARRLTDRADRMARAVVFILQDVIATDAQSLRQHLASMRIEPPVPK